MSVQIHQARRDEIPALAQIMSASWKAAFSGILSPETMKARVDREKLSAMLERFFDLGVGAFYIAYDEAQTPLAELCWKPESAGRAEIVTLQSIPESWGTGAGRAIMEFALGQLRAAGMQSVFLWVFEENHRARRFYEKCGFHWNGDSRFSRFDSVPEICCQCRLAD